MNRQAHPRRCPSCGGSADTDWAEIEAASVRPFTCMICFHAPTRAEHKVAKFKTPEAIAQHIAAKHHHACPDCEKVCTTASGLAAHRATKHAVAET